ncbi:PIN domain-containing protein [Streptomyces sp. NPDC026673]|uniref:PIN domain-containing protein n=1 Tax=Streptomyces sp. NPDC026673 TaxID=3155724 RepID=UPI0033FA33F6
MIIVDSNQIRFVLPHSPALKLFAAVAQRAGHTLATTDIVLREVVRQHRENLTSAINGYRRAHRALNELLPPAKRLHDTRLMPEHPVQRAVSMSKHVEQFEADVRANFLVLPTTPEDALAALNLEADHLDPGLNGAGARDASIWLTAVRAAATRERDSKGRLLPVIFVSSDGDFTAPGKSRGLAPHLMNDDTRKGRLLLKSTVVDAMDAFGYPQQLVEAEEITQRNDFQEALTNVITTSADLPTRQQERMVEAEVEVRLISGQKGRRCSGNHATVTTVTGRWSVRFIFERLPRSPGGNSAYRGLPAQVEGMALIVDERDQGATIEFAPQRVTVAGKDVSQLLA